ncbi:hypothetical protein EYF80_063361 [Liparis tanakae]|uniref:Uncharacterized protein n=1 Tax=Liparis tanakae TaxID=230148 RepID=A0A4Z2EDZ7_9TELE|nr:hypothetical protein EYF80_063361 [Liparis tanakae]
MISTRGSSTSEHVAVELLWKTANSTSWRSKENSKRNAGVPSRTDELRTAEEKALRSDTKDVFPTGYMTTDRSPEGQAITRSPGDTDSSQRGSGSPEVSHVSPIPHTRITKPLFIHKSPPCSHLEHIFTLPLGGVDLIRARPRCAQLQTDVGILASRGSSLTMRSGKDNTFHAHLTSSGQDVGSESNIVSPA